jgi:ribonucleoside-triphosphate reductase
MINEIIKRDETTVPFDKEKITRAIEKAMNASGFKNNKPKEEAKKLTDEVVEEIEKQGPMPPHVEQVQDMVERILIKHNYPDLAKAYIIYRRQHQELRESISMSEQLELIDSYIYETDWMVNENANMGYSLQGLNTFLTSKITSVYWLNRVYPVAAKTAHKSGDIHIHQLNALGPYCVGWDLKDLFMKGFRGAAGKIESNPPKHLRTALMQIVNFFYTLQGECVGAQALSNFDTYLAPFVRFDGLSYLEVKQAMQEFVFNMNVPTRVGFQTPFTNLTMDLLVPDHIKNEAVIIGGKLTSNTYSEFQEEVNMINRAFAEVMSAGDASGRVFTFPIPTYNITKGFDWDNPNYNALWEMTGKYGIPYFSNFVNSDMKPEDARSMCCRLRLDTRELKKRGGGLFGANPLTGSIGVITVNLPRIGFLSKSEGEFIERLGKIMDVCKDALEVKRVILEKLTERGLYPYSKYYLKGIKAAYGQYWKNHFSTIGIIGMNEACTNLLGKDISDKQSREFAIRVLDFIRARLEEYQLQTNNIYNLEATPAESTSYALASRDKELYGKIIVANEEAYRKSNAAPYYTNSSHLPVGYTDDVFAALVHQDELQTKYTGGTVIHVFLGENMPSIESTKKLVRKIAENFKLPYYTLTPTFSICPKHGYMSGSHEYCPKCDEAILDKMLNKVIK